MMEHLNFRAIPISQRRSRVKCLTHTLLRVVMFWERILIIRRKLKGLTVLRALSVRLIKSDAPAKLAGSNLWVSRKSIWKLYEVFTTAGSNWRLIRFKQADEETVHKITCRFSSMDKAIITLDFVHNLW